MMRKNPKLIVMCQRRINSFETIPADYVGVVILIILFTVSSVIMFKSFLVIICSCLHIFTNLFIKW